MTYSILKKVLLIMVIFLSALSGFSLGVFEMDAPPLEVIDADRKDIDEFVKSFYSFLNSDLQISEESVKDWFFDDFIWVEIRHNAPDYKKLRAIKDSEGVQALYKTLVDIYGEKKSIDFQETLYYTHMYDDPTPVYMISYNVIYDDIEIIERFYIAKVDGKYKIKTLFLFD